MPELVPIQLAADEIGVNVRTLHRWCHEGLIDRYRRRGDPHTLVDMLQVRQIATPRKASGRDTDPTDS